MRPEDLARELGIDGKRLRGWLRGRYPRAPEEHGAHWFLTEQQIAEARRAFVGSRVRSSRPGAVCPATPIPAALARPATKLTASRPSWSQVQHHTDAVLAAGLRTLLRRPAARWGPTDVHGAGVYLFSAGESVFYVGEATAVSSRVAQHLKPDSVFLTGLRSAGGSDLSDLRVRSLPVALGRLELEEFAIACTRPSGNRMRLHSRTALAWEDADLDLWERVQAGAPRLLRTSRRSGDTSASACLASRSRQAPPVVSRHPTSRRSTPSSHHARSRSCRSLWGAGSWSGSWSTSCGHSSTGSMRRQASGSARSA